MLADMCPALPDISIPSISPLILTTGVEVIAGSAGVAAGIDMSIAMDPSSSISPAPCATAAVANNAYAKIWRSGSIIE